jgi:hypothetical protein
MVLACLWGLMGLTFLEILVGLACCASLVGLMSSGKAMCWGVRRR